MSKIVIIISVDWEGRSLLSENLQLIAEFRRRHPDVPMQHFLNAAYFTRPGIDPAWTTEMIRSALLPQDDHALHIHAWHSLLAAAGVPGRCAPRFLDDDARVPKAADDWGFYPPEDGYDVPLEHFEAGELDRVIQTSREILAAQGFRSASSFRAGGWMSGPRVQAALAKNGFSVDCSAVDHRLSVRRFGDIPLSRWLAELWPSIDEMSQPYRIATDSGELWQLPNNAGLVDFTSVEDLLGIFEHHVALWQAAPDRLRFLSTGFHQETARKFLDRLDEVIGFMKHAADERHLPLVFTSQPQELLV